MPRGVGRGSQGALARPWRLPPWLPRPRPSPCSPMSQFKEELMAQYPRTRHLGLNPRALGTNPRAKAQNKWALRNWKRQRAMREWAEQVLREWRQKEAAGGDSGGKR